MILNNAADRALTYPLLDIFNTNNGSDVQRFGQAITNDHASIFMNTHAENLMQYYLH